MEARRRIGQGCRSLSQRAVGEVYDAVSESALIEELEVGARVGRQRRLAPPTTMGQTNSWHSSTSPALKACAARFAPPTVRSVLAAAFSSCTAVGSKWRSSRVLAVDTAARVRDLVVRDLVVRDLVARDLVVGGLGSWAIRSVARPAACTAARWASRRVREESHYVHVTLVKPNEPVPQFAGATSAARETGSAGDGLLGLAVPSRCRAVSPAAVRVWRRPPGTGRPG